MAAPSTIGPYQVVRELGRGGMGVVLEVRRPGVERRLALKLMTLDGVEPMALERFGREAQALAKVKHPNVLAVHELGRTPEGRPYIVTDFIEGPNLRAVARGEPVPPERAARIVAALCGAVHALHEKTILHRDLKPENVMLRGDEDPVLLDFGLAREHDARSLTQSGMALGTPAYMSPEQADGKKGQALDERTDVYGLGAILFELLAGRQPFDTAGDFQKIVQVLTKDPKWPIETRKEIPPALDGLVRRAMAKKREDRFATAKAFQGELEKFLRKESVVKAPPPAGGGRGPLVAGAVVVAAVVAAGAFLATRPHPPEPQPAIAPPPGVVSSTTAPEPATARIPTETFTPSPVGFRALIAWVASKATPEQRTDPRVSKRRNELLAEQLLSVDVPGAAAIHPFFLTDRWLAIFSDEIHVLDLNQPAAPKPSLLWRAPTGRVWEAALCPVDSSGVCMVYVAGQAGVFRIPFDQAIGPPANGAEVPALEVFDSSAHWGNLFKNGVASIAIANGLLAYPWRGEKDWEVKLRDLSRGGALVRSYPIQLADEVRWVTFLTGGKELLVGCHTPNKQSSVVHFSTDNAVQIAAKGQLEGDLAGFSLARRRGADAFAFAPGGHPLYFAERFSHVRDFEETNAEDLEKIQRLVIGGHDDTFLHAVSQSFTEQRATKFIVRRLSDLKTPMRSRSLGPGQANALALSPDGTLVAIGGTFGNKRLVQVWAAGD